MMVSNYLLVAGCLLSFLFGCLTSLIAMRTFHRIPRTTTENIPVRERVPPQNEKEIESLASSLFHLTSQVDSQIGQHTERVSEITNSLTGPESDGSANVLDAGKKLITANEKLQSELEEAKQEIQKQRKKMNSCIRESLTDPLTNLANRRALDIELSRAFVQHRRDGTKFSLLIMDIDYFKRINDQYGHMVGDQLLKCFSRCLTNTFRDGDFVARFGGEEFVAILKKTPLEDACKAAERIRSVIAVSRYKVGDLEISMTASIGVREIVGDATEEEILKKADEALYAAKNGGRNRCYYHNGEICLQFVPTATSDIHETADLSPETPIEPANKPVLLSQDGLSRSAMKASSPTNADKHIQ